MSKLKFVLDSFFRQNHVKIEYQRVMKNEHESEEEVQETTSCSSEVLESIDLIPIATSSTEPNILSRRRSSESDTSKNSSKSKPVPLKTPKVVSEALDDVLEATVQEPATSSEQHTERTTEQAPNQRLFTSQPNLRSPRNNLLVYRNDTGIGLVNSTGALHSENYLKKASSKKSVTRVPPSYSTVLKLGAPLYQYDPGNFPSIPFITRQPPPSYAEVHGGWDESPSIVSSDSFSLGPNPVYVPCPRCRTIVVSDIHSERSTLTYVISLMLCLCMCWPCCLLPFCVKACRNTYHFCPTCHYYLGVYRPC